MSVAYTNARIFTGDRFLSGQAVLTDHGVILGVLPMSEIPADTEVIDLQGATLAPALIDLQIYGGNGQLFPYSTDVASLAATYDYCYSGGAAHFMPTIPTTSWEVMLRSIQAVKEYWSQGRKGVLGLHLEGPFMNPEKKGAHLEHYIVTPTEKDIDRLLEHGEGIIKMMTLAPERCDPRLVKRLQSAGILISAGHSNASYEQGYAAFENGIPAATHLFNAMSALQSRAPGMVGAIYDHDRVCASVVADGIHVDFSSIRISKKIMGNRLYLITDAVAECREGDYIYIFEKDRYVNAQGTLAGSCLTMMQAVRNCVQQVGIPVEEALRMGSAYPAALAGKGHELGRIAAGYKASMVAFDANLQVVRMIGE
ncbi:N-acetylglucosamine-6-phosphate deacetylase [Chitinophaga agrisoli]|uniref:N-acetylglucosamine-6-phosphate deacetylase n=1 Tax=Chitinophaga agrisoli TaxID=2607653 RepID=A0A5B2W0S0_9BACT|nr:N-acetylglucosamine-6-phosphate deacetylase [Chitinophaga agrisoli]KAA2245281.1 N-acetylglucosamine-6-phosphate deacetylase [Chitinophaga agrisoli]